MELIKNIVMFSVLGFAILWFFQLTKVLVNTDDFLNGGLVAAFLIAALAFTGVMIWTL